MRRDDDNDDGDLDQLLREHLSRQLDPQLGRAGEAFERSAPAAAGGPRRGGMMPMRRGLAAGIATSAAIAASVLLAWTALRTHLPPPPTSPPRSPTIVRAADTTPRDVQRVVAWQAVDEGPLVIGSSVPVRQLRYEAVQQVQWFDPVRRATIRTSVPQQQVILVQQQVY